ncbi:MAG: Beta-galactosidase [Myxococcaceae bacterium]|nr:Beta-galactosidase [Myxococcaceae bacterium]
MARNTLAKKRAPGSSSKVQKAVEVRPQGLWLADKNELVPMWAGAMHYWRHAPEDWSACLDAMKAMGLRLVDTYVPWGVHETAQGVFDFGERYGRLDVARFVRLCGEKGMHVIARPGPHINAELTYFGLPERVVWDRECQARTPRDNPVILPLVPVAFPVPSYASDAFFDETALWFEACGRVLSPLLHPHGPIVMLQVDNEGALYFRDGPYDQDYHPDAIRLFRTFLREKYSSVKTLREIWNDESITFATVTPPVKFDAKEANELARHLDWMEFHEHLLAEAMGRFNQSLENAGLTTVPTLHNFPLGEAATPLNASRMAEVVDLIGLDYYHPANPQHHMTILRRTGELATRCEGRQVPPFGAEVGAGFPPFFPPLDDKDSLYALMAAMAYGLRGFNLYMAVDRDRWVGAPIDVHGIPRRLADEYHALIEALDKVAFNTLHRATPVKLVVPRALRRLARATHAFGPVTPAAFHIAGAGPLESCLEDDFGLGEIAPIVGESFVRAFERALLARGVPFSYAGGESLEMSIVGASWIVCTTAGGLKADFFTSLREAHERGILVTIGPRVPDRDGSMRLLAKPHDVRGLEVEALDEPSRADVLVARRIDELALPAYPVDVPDVHVTVHDDEQGVPRVAFVMNPTAKAVVATVGLGRTRVLVDMLPRPRAVNRIEPHAGTGAFVVEVPARTVRMFSIET